MPKVSVVVPVYGVEKYIERCARSLFEQTLDDIEYIFVDDCTPDKSIHILKETLKDYPKRESLVKIERMSQNSGLPAVRKFGSNLATGDYIIACDSDDYVDKDMYRLMYDYASRNNLDLVQCDIEIVNDVGVITTLSSNYSKLSSEDLKECIISGSISNSLCNKLVKREIYQNQELIFPKVGMDEDNALSVQLAFFSNRLGYIKQALYKAYQNNSSISRIPGEEKTIRRFNESLENSKLIVDFLLRRGYREDSFAVLRAKIRPKQIIWKSLKHRHNIELWINTYPEINYIVFLNKHISYKVKIKFFIVMFLYRPLRVFLK